MRSMICALFVAFVFVSSQARAVTIGGTFDVDPTLGVNALSGAVGSFTTNSHPNADLGALLNNWGGLFDGDANAQRRLNFTGADPAGPNPNNSIQGTFGNSVFNNAGFDILAFEQGDTPEPTSDPAALTNTEVELLAASTTGNNGSWSDFQVVGFLTSAQIGGTSTDFGVYVFALDLSDLGIAAGASISNLFFGNTTAYNDHDPDIIWVGGVDGAASAAVVPLPAALPLFGTGLGLMGLFGWRRRRRAAAAA